ncbi:YIP1 family protein [Haladaptatus sp. DFWS20]|uniref:YIP1 family protein n=1 Tax=Haladaptatus sp. DFWS20 TaxID=3403467 RepID=UPI003EB6DF23
MTLHTIQTVLFSPDSFFARRKSAPALVLPVLVVACVGLLDVVEPLLAMVVLDANDPKNFLPTVVGVGFVLTFVVWLFYSVAFYAISSLFDAEGSLRDTMAVTGWGYLPSIIHSALMLVVVAVELDPSSAGIAGPQPTMEMLAGGAVGSLLLRLVGLLFALWRAYIWVAGVQHVRNVTRRQAIVSVGIPVAIVIIPSLLGVSFPV